MKKSWAREIKSKIKTWSKLKKHMKWRFLPLSYKQELYLRITYPSQANLKVEEYMWEFEQLQMRVGLIKIMSSLLLDSSRVYLLILLTRWR